MNHLIIFGHPSLESLNKTILDEVVHICEANGNNVVTRDLYKMKFDPVLTKEEFCSQTVSEDINREQEYVKNADVVIFIYPLWWAGMPAIVKGYIDRVFSNGFAYSIDNNGIKKLLKNKKVIIINTHRSQMNDYTQKGVYNSISILTQQQIFEFCGMEVLMHYYFDEVTAVADKIALKTKLDALRYSFKNKLLKFSKINMSSNFFF